MRQFTCPKAVTHPSTNRARCRATALIETNALPLHQTANQSRGSATPSVARGWAAVGPSNTPEVWCDLLIKSLLQIYCWVRRWKNFESRSTSGEVIDKSIVTCFHTHRVIENWQSSCICNAGRTNSLVYSQHINYLYTWTVLLPFFFWIFHFQYFVNSISLITEFGCVH